MDLRNVLRKTPVDKLTLLPAGETGMHSPAELLASERMRRLVEEVKTRYNDRYIIFDTPPVQATTEPSVLAGAMDCVLMVVRRNGADKAAIEESIELLDDTKSKACCSTVRMRAVSRKIQIQLLPLRISTGRIEEAEIVFIEKDRMCSK